MKKTFLFLSIIALMVISSCGKDDDSPALGLSGTLTYDGQTYAIANGIFSLSQSNGNAEGTFFLADGTLESNASNNVSSSDSQIIISILATSKNTPALVNGDYATSTNVPDKYADISVTTATGTKEAFTGGTLSISGSGNSYNITFDVPFGQGINLTGSVNGTYDNP